MSYFGVAFATLALAIGLFFFVFYAARYYIFTATVLFLNLFGRNGHNGNAHGNGNGHGNRNGYPNGSGSNRNGLRRLISRVEPNKKSSYQNGNGNGNGQNHSGFNDLVVEPLVSIHLPMYNEANVAERLLTACTSLDYKNYEVIVVDDSTDQTTDILRAWAESNQIPMTLTDGGSQAQVQVVQTLLSFRTPVKIIHRNNRSGFKGGALNEALKHMNPKAEYVIILDADFIPPPDIIRRFLAYFATSAPATVLAELVKLDRKYAEGKISLEEYLTERQILSAKLTENRVVTESFQLAHRSLFELDQLFAEGTISADEYLVRRNAIMRELNKSSWVGRSLENKLTLRQSFTICKLFSEDKVESSDFKVRMQMISPPSSGRVVKPKNDTAALFLQILDLDQRLAKGSIDLKTYAKQRETLAAQLLVLSEDRDKLKAKFELDQQLAAGKITVEEYLERQNGKNGNNGPRRIVHLISRNGNNGNGNGVNGKNGGNRNGYVAVQGYQLHYLNRSENWLTQGIRAEFSGSYMIERTCEELIGAMKMIAGSVYMIKADTLRKYGWAESLTEDWELTCRLYRDGNRVIYTATIQAPAECPSTIKRLIRQRQRWAEGHTFNAKRYFWRILRSPHVTPREKLEFIYFAPYYLQSVFFVAGTFFWLVSEYLHEYPPFWNQTFGWALLLSNLMALPLMNLAGLFSERTAKKDATGIFSAIVLSYILSVFQAYAALKGLLEKREGTWIRTYKTGVITETIRKLQIGKFWRSITKPRHKSTKAHKSTASDGHTEQKGEPEGKRRSSSGRGVVGKALRSIWDKSSSRGSGRKLLSVLLLMFLSSALFGTLLLSTFIPQTTAIPSNTKWYFRVDATQGSSVDACGTTWGRLSETTGEKAQTLLGSAASKGLYCWASDNTYTVGSGDSGDWVFHFVWTANSIGAGKTVTVKVYLSLTQTTKGTEQGTGTWTTTAASSGTQDITIPVTVTELGSGYYVQFSFHCDGAANKSFIMDTASSTGSYLIVPEGAIALLVLAPFLPILVLRRARARRRSIGGCQPC